MSDQKEFLKGTTTVGVTFEKGVVVAADKRATMGTFIASKEVEKIHAVSDRMVVTMAGGVGDAQSLVRMIRAELELYKYTRGEPLSVEGAATLLANVLQGNKYYPYLVQLIVAGYDEKPRLFDIDLAGGLLPDKYVSTGSGSVVAYGILDDGYKDGMDQQAAAKLAAKAISSAMKRDNATGEGIDIIAITGAGIKRYSKQEIEALV
ncbi:Proteasome subunit beta [Candidatus Norongarragalina meridionalis]|nr:Proteasome subunit beta [Candidatus Norongarragalina meridionalis]